MHQINKHRLFLNCIDDVTFFKQNSLKVSKINFNLVKTNFLFVDYIVRRLKELLKNSEKQRREDSTFTFSYHLCMTEKSEITLNCTDGVQKPIGEIAVSIPSRQTKFIFANKTIKTNRYHDSLIQVSQ